MQSENTVGSTVITEELVIGAGQIARHGNDVVVHYTGRLASNDAQFDSSIKRRDPLDFSLGAGDVIKGWDQGIACRLTIPPELAYGEHGLAGIIPPHATLVFEIELLDVT